MGFAMRQHAHAVVGEETGDGLVAGGVAAPEAFGFQGGEIEPIEKRPLPLGRGAGAGEIDRLSLLNDRAVAAAFDRRARVRVGILAAALPQRPRRRPGRVEYLGARPAARAIELADQGDAFFGPVDVGEAELRLDQLVRLTLE